ncbi:protein MANBAL isoform X1 [Mycteria americana]|uniref:protein MANBAL isoform X1 n=1 Tax=Mycteria americana TaxID=33587 RepID=UPI003F582DB0
MLAKEEVVKLLASQEPGGRLHYHPGTRWISCKAKCKEVVLLVRKPTLQVLSAAWKAVCLALSPGSPLFSFGLLLCVYELGLSVGVCPEKTPDLPSAWAEVVGFVHHLKQQGCDHTYN